MLSAYIDRRLSAGEQGALEHHLEGCEGCRVELETLRQTVRLLHQVPLVSAPRSFILAQAEPRRRSIVLGRPSPGWLRPATAVATLLLVAVLLGDFLNVLEAGPGEVEPSAPAERLGIAMLAPEKGAAVEVEEAQPQEALPAPVGERGGWPLRQLEIAFGVLAVVLGSMTIIASWQSRRR